VDGGRPTTGEAARYRPEAECANKSQDDDLSHLVGDGIARRLADRLDVGGLLRFVISPYTHPFTCARVLGNRAARPPRGPTSAWAFEEAMRETDIPAEQPETEEEARLSAPDAEPSGTRGDPTPAQQGPLQPFSLIWRVRGQSSFQALARGPRRRAGNLEVRTAVLGPVTDPPRVAFSVGRSVGDAVTRNRVRRRLRAALRDNAAELESGAAYLVRATPAARHDSYAELSSTLRAILAQNRADRS
jgi:ribonuclease P protein component